MILQKAWAKFLGCYHLIESLEINEVLEGLTGGVSSQIDIKDKLLYDKMNAGFKKKWIVTGTSKEYSNTGD